MKTRAIIGYVFGVLWNLPHIVATYQIIDTITGLPVYYIWFMVGVIDYTILILAMRRDREMEVSITSSGVFSIIVFLLNLFLYWIEPINSGAFLDFGLANISTLFIKLVFAAVPAFIIFYYSEMIADLFPESSKTDRAELEMVRVQIGNLRVDLENNRKTIDIYKPAFESISAFKGESINISGVKAKVCECSRLVKAGSNKQGSLICECGELIEWN